MIKIENLVLPKTFPNKLRAMSDFDTIIGLIQKLNKEYKSAKEIEKNISDCNDRDKNYTAEIAQNNLLIIRYKKLLALSPLENTIVSLKKIDKIEQKLQILKEKCDLENIQESLKEFAKSDVKFHIEDRANTDFSIYISPYLRTENTANINPKQKDEYTSYDDEKDNIVNLFTAIDVCRSNLVDASDLEEDEINHTIDQIITLVIHYSNKAFLNHDKSDLKNKNFYKKNDGSTWIKGLWSKEEPKFNKEIVYNDCDNGAAIGELRRQDKANNEECQRVYKINLRREFENPDINIENYLTNLENFSDKLKNTEHKNKIESICLKLKTLFGGITLGAVSNGPGMQK